MTTQPAEAGDSRRRRTREEVRVGYRMGGAPVATTPPTPLPPPQPKAPTRLPPVQAPVVAAAPKPPKDLTTPAVSINIQLPTLDVRKRFKRLAQPVTKPLTLAYKHRGISLGLLAGLLVLGGGGWVAYHHRSSAQGSAAGSSGGGDVSTHAVAATPTFTPVVPVSKPDLGKVGAQSAFDGNHKVYSYIDSINKQRITVSEQQPAIGTSAATAAETASKSLNANKVITTSAGDIYVYTNTKYSAQTVVGSVNNLLIFLQSSQIIGDNDWKTYVENLQ